MMLRTGALGEQTGRLMSTLGSHGNQDQLAADLATMMEGSTGTMGFADALQISERISAVARRIGDGGEAAFRSAAALVAVARPSVGSPEEAVTAVDSLTAELLTRADDVRKQTGVSVVDERGNLRADLNAVLAEMGRAFQDRGGAAAIAKLFGEAARRPVQQLTNESERQRLAEAGAIRGDPEDVVRNTQETVGRGIEAKFARVRETVQPLRDRGSRTGRRAATGRSGVVGDRGGGSSGRGSVCFGGGVTGGSLAQPVELAQRRRAAAGGLARCRYQRCESAR